MIAYSAIGIRHQMKSNGKPNPKVKHTKIVFSV